LEKVWEWRTEKGGIILEQLRRLGASCDWERTQFTMDPHYSRAVLTVFVDLFKKGHIYRGKRMVNWCPVSQTALSDEEVIMKPVSGFLYHVPVREREDHAPRDDPRRRRHRRASR
jgi:valyl-tRNA synthetase